VSTPQLQITPEIARTAAVLRVRIGRLSRRLKARSGAGDLTMPEVLVLARLERCGPASPGELARAEQVQPQSMGATLAGLAEHALVSRSHDPDDRRRVVISLTEAGRQVVYGVRRDREEVLSRAIAEALSPAEREQLNAVLPLLEKLASQL
jgi:DNA-binding MarR family transcriptional regulator